MSSSIKVVFGGGSVGAMNENFNTKKAVEELLDVLEEEKFTIIDTAEIYPNSEQLLGEFNAADRFTIDTKLPSGFAGGGFAKEDILKSAEGSLERLKTKSVNIYYLHAPDRKTHPKDTLAALDQLHKQGKFKHLGISNFTPEEVEEFVRVAKENNYVVPTVYQGNYSAVARKVETTLFPILRKHNIAFYAYSPMAGGFLTKTKEQILQGAGRFNLDSGVGRIYANLYNKPSLVEALSKWSDISESSGIPKGELAYRWVAYNSPLKPEYGDAIIVGTRDLAQTRETAAALRKGPLSAEVVQQIDEFWKLVEAEAPVDNFNSSNF